jgi:phytoene dehydrogenase-like protein
MGVHWAYAPIDAAHPLDDGDAGLLYTSVERTSRELGLDAKQWFRAFGAPSTSFEDLAQDIMGPLVGIPRHPLQLARFGLVAGPPPSLVRKWFRTEKARALYMGVAAHALQRLDRPLVGGIGAGIITAGHFNGWPVVEGGTGLLTRAHIRALRNAGVQFVTDHRINRHEDLPPADITILDVHPREADRILADRLPPRVRRAYRRFRSGPAAFKVDFALHEGIPWTHPDVGRAGTVHLGGSAEEIIAVEQEIAAGKMPERPFVLVGQQFVADPARSSDGMVPVYAYAHVPHGYTGDATEKIIRQIERFAPGFRERIAATRVTAPADFEAQNSNFPGGDILTGAKSPMQLLLGPKPGMYPYDTGVPGTYLCSAATPPGPGIHGMGGFHAAQRALHVADRQRSLPQSDRAEDYVTRRIGT